MKLLQIDAFTDRPFTGNPAAVCLLEKAAEGDWMQRVAAEMNLSETAFVYPLDPDSQPHHYSLRWFTPTTEVDLCGHATLATAHALWSEMDLPQEATLRFHTRSGILLADRHDDWICLNFPPNVSQTVANPPAALLDGLNLDLASLDPLPVSINSLGYVVELAQEETVKTLQPNLACWDSLGVPGVIVTCRGQGSTTPQGEPYDFLSRFFAPGLGIPEDPVTGAAHCCLGPYWQERLGKHTFLAYQASSRGGILRLAIQDDRILIQGQAITVVRGELLP